MMFLMQDQSLKALLQDFFFVLDEKVVKSARNSENYIYDKFLMAQPKQSRDGVLEAIYSVCGVPGNFQTFKRNLEARLGKKGRICKSRFAACLCAMGMEYQTVSGSKYWINVGMRRKPKFRNEK
jgi:hypothetical protein